MHSGCLQFIFLTFAILYCRSDEVTSQSTKKDDGSLSNPLVWLLVKQIDRLENKVEKLNIIHYNDIKNLRGEVQRMQNTETFVGFHAKILANKQLVSDERLIFNHVLYNTGNAYDRYGGNFKAPYNGEYFFTSSFLSAGVHTVHLQMLKNGDEISKGHGTTPRSNTGTMSAVVHLKVGDSVYVQHMKTSASETIHGEWSYFTGFLLRRTD